MQPAAPRNTTASQQCTQFWVLPALVLLALCTPLASAAREWAAQTWSEHLPGICTAVLLYHAARNWASSLARRIPTLASTQAARDGPSPTSNVNSMSTFVSLDCHTLSSTAHCVTYQPKCHLHTSHARSNSLDRCISHITNSMFNRKYRFTTI